MTWLTEQAPGSTPFQRVLGLRPELERLFSEYYGQLWDRDLVDPVLLELCRLRIAQVHGDPGQQRLRHEPAVDAGLTEDKVAQLSRYYESPLYSEHERTCLNYAEQFVIDVHSITDEQADAVKRGMTEQEFVAFTVALGLLDGIGRFRLVLGVDAGADGPDPVLVPAPTPGRPAH